jgi:hypothetical protein
MAAHNHFKVEATNKIIFQTSSRKEKLETVWSNVA